ncbi:MAG: GNAT family N-acetyltransferase [Bacilli bacterium]|nr:GNAT family N-acetyltransferase [Bacilli bacterium]
MANINWNFRLANINDSEKLDILLTKLIQDERKYDDSIDPDFKVKNFYCNVLNKNNKIIYLCKLSDIICGYIYLIIEDYSAKIDALYVEENFRGKSIGSKLIEWALNYVNDYNIKSVTINVMSENQNAKKLYQKYGFKIIDETEKRICMEYSKELE